MTTTATIPKVGKINWASLKGKLKDEFQEFADVDFSFEEGKTTRLLQMYRRNLKILRKRMRH